MFCLHICLLPHVCLSVPVVHGAQKRVSDPLELEVWVAVRVLGTKHRSSAVNQSAIYLSSTQKTRLLNEISTINSNNRFLRQFPIRR